MIKLVQDTLSQDSAGQWLLILDNADDMDMWLNTDMGTRSTRLIDCLPRSNKGSIVHHAQSEGGRQICGGTYNPGA